MPSQQQSRSIVRADVHRQQEFAARNAHLQATTGNFITHILKINIEEKFDEKVDEINIFLFDFNTENTLANKKAEIESASYLI